MNDNKINYPIGELPQSASQSSQAVDEIAEKKRNQKKSLIKLGAMGVLTAVTIIIGSISWFTMNREVEGSGVQMTASGANFEISSPTGGNLSPGLWYDPYHKKIRDDNSESNAELPSYVWMMSDESNFGNYRYSDETERIGGIKPGSYGKVTFNVTPLVDEINLEFDFDIIGYHSSDSLFDEGNENTPLTLTPVADMGSKGEDIANYLNGHILLFENRTPVYETITEKDPNTGEETVTVTQNILRYDYSGLIATDEDMSRVLNNTAKTHFSGKNTVTPVDIYWIWPNTLSTIVDIGGDDLTSVPCSTADKDRLADCVLTHPQYFLKGYVADTSGNSDNNGSEENGGEENSSGSSLTLQDIIDDYELYSDMYDMADNDIGMNVNYILLKLTASENTLTDDNEENVPDP